MTKQTRIYLVRHGESIANQQGIIGGSTDTHLTEQGREQARLTKLELQAVNFDAAYSSNLRRAIDTAEIIYGKPVPPLHQIDGLKERSFGSLEGKPDEHLVVGNKEKRTLPNEQRLHHRHVPDMESDHEVTLRFLPALETVAKQNFGKTILIVAHGSAIRTIIMEVSKLTYNEIPPGSFKNGGYAELTYDRGRFKVIQISGIPI